MLLVLKIRSIVYYKLQFASSFIKNPRILQLFFDKQCVSVQIPDGLYVSVNYSTRRVFLISSVSKFSRIRLKNFLRGLRCSEFSLFRVFYIRLFLKGVGFRYAVSKDVGLSQEVLFFMGYSHPIHVVFPLSICLNTSKTSSHILLSSKHKQLLFTFAHSLKILKPAAYYTGKGLLVLQYREKFRYGLLIKKK